MDNQRSNGCFLGAMVGDAAGATLEFYMGEITEKIARKAMKMPGGGCLRVGPGQATDDTELAFQLARSIADVGHYDDRVALGYYKDWFNSGPFDIGNTCSRAFGSRGTNHKQFAEISQANGALMRVFPIAIYGAAKNAEDEAIAGLARADAMLSHPSKVCQDCNALYCIAIAHLLRFEGDIDGCIRRVAAYIKNNEVSDEVEKWFREAVESEGLEGFDCSRNIGWCRWAFTLAFHFLAHGVGYEDAIFQTLMLGGDTDTNAAIVGGMLGACYGISGIPDYMKDPVLAFDCTKKYRVGYTRPDVYKATDYKMLCDKISV